MYTATRCIGFLTGVGVMDGGGLGFLLRGFTVAAVGDSSLRYASFRMTDAPPAVRPGIPCEHRFARSRPYRRSSWALRRGGMHPSGFPPARE